MKIYGKCHLCGKEGKLTFEHLPPEKANNNREAHAITGDALVKHIGGIKDPWDFKGVRYKSLQRGMGAYTLCSKCNNNTGNWYANDYINFSNSIGYALNNDIDKENVQSIYVKLRDMYPLRIIKQIICMFISTMNLEFLEENPDLREFVKNKESRNFNNQKYRISMYFLKQPRNGWSGLNVLLYSDLKTKTVAYMDLYPVGYILEIDPTEDKYDYVLDITNFATDFSYDFKGTIEIESNILERNTVWVGDFRTKEEIKKQILENKKKTIQIVREQMEELKIPRDKYDRILQEYIDNQISPEEFSAQIESLRNKR